jgi:hypothetical protein
VIHADHRARPLFEPHYCSFTLRGDDPEGFFEGRNLTGPADVAYISVSRVRTYAEALGFASPTAHAALEEELTAAQSRVTELESQLAALEQKFDAIDVLASAGFVARKKTGRRPTEKQEATA